MPGATFELPGSKWGQKCSATFEVIRFFQQVIIGFKYITKIIEKCKNNLADFPRIPPTHVWYTITLHTIVTYVVSPFLCRKAWAEGLGLPSLSLRSPKSWKRKHVKQLRTDVFAPESNHARNIFETTNTQRLVLFIFYRKQCQSWPWPPRHISTSCWLDVTRLFLESIVNFVKIVLGKGVNQHIDSNRTHQHISSELFFQVAFDFSLPNWKKTGKKQHEKYKELSVNYSVNTILQGSLIKETPYTRTYAL